MQLDLVKWKGEAVCPLNLGATSMLCRIDHISLELQSQAFCTGLMTPSAEVHFLEFFHTNEWIDIVR
jgi:hypothetical protein